jgi:hypothetical protein
MEGLAAASTDCVAEAPLEAQTKGQILFDDLFSDAELPAQEQSPEKSAVSAADAFRCGQPRPSIKHKIAVLDAFKLGCPVGRDMPFRNAIVSMARSHRGCCGQLNAMKLRRWMDSRKEEEWDTLSEEVQSTEYRIPNQIRHARGLNPIGSDGPMHAKDKEVADLIKLVTEKADERAKRGRAPSFDDLHDTFHKRLKLLNESRLRHNEEVRAKAEAHLANAIEAGTSNASVAAATASEIMNDMKVLCPLQGSRPWVAKVCREHDLKPHAQQTRGEQAMRNSADPEVVDWMHERDALAYDNRNTEVPWLRVNFDECPTPFWAAKKKGWCSDEAASGFKAKKEGNIWQDTPARAKDYFSSGTCTTPLGHRMLFLHFKENAAGGQRQVVEMNKQIAGKAYVLREGTGYMTSECFSRKVVPWVILPVLDRARRETRTWKGAGNGLAQCLWDGPEVHKLSEAAVHKLQEHEAYEQKMLSRTSGYLQPEDQLHFVYKARLHKLVRNKMGRSGDILAQKDDEDEDRTAVGNVLRGLNVALLTECAVEAFDSISRKEIMAAWLLANAITLEEAMRCLVKIGESVAEDSKKAVLDACVKLIDANREVEQPASVRRTLLDIIPSAPSHFSGDALRNRRAALLVIDYSGLAGILEGSNADFPSQELLLPTGRKLRFLFFHDTGLLLNHVRRRVQRDGITEMQLAQTGIGRVLTKYALHHPIPMHRTVAKEVVALMRNSCGRQPPPNKTGEASEHAEK